MNIGDKCSFLLRKGNQSARRPQEEGGTGGIQQTMEGSLEEAWDDYTEGEVMKTGETLNSAEEILDKEE